MLEKLLQFERGLFFALNGSESVLLDHFFWLYSQKWIWLPFYLCLLIVIVYKKDWKKILLVLGAVTLVVLLCDQITSGLMKPMFERFRPTRHPDFMNDVKLVFGYRGGGAYGFASSHASNTFGIATFLAYLLKQRFFGITMFMFAAVSAYSRVYLGVHFISDIVVGAIIGVLVGIVIYKVYFILKRRIFNLSTSEMQKRAYSKSAAIALGIIYMCFVLCLFLFDNQLVDLLN
ncbi:phosphatase PAP2 family protein [Bacteroidales bacterium OttesenSCG-928-I14]|nr:phosphatase PAP2 family protein [Bacteroidales bacterium OttesenSCG-928-I14]